MSSSSDYTALKRINYVYTYQNPSYYTNTCCSTICCTGTGTTTGTGSGTGTDSGTNLVTLSNTVSPVLITPIVGGSVGFTLRPNLLFTAGLPVTCSSTSDYNNYFEGYIWSYDAITGAITINNILHVAGSFNLATTYLVNVTNNINELHDLREKMSQLYLEMYNINVNDPLHADLNLSLITSQRELRDLYEYFFNENILNETGYEMTTIYLTSKIDYLYWYFFDKILYENPDPDTGTVDGWNPNITTNIALTTLDKKISELYYYFFNISNQEISKFHIINV